MSAGSGPPTTEFVNTDDLAADDPHSKHHDMSVFMANFEILMKWDKNSSKLMVFLPPGGAPPSPKLTPAIDQSF